MPARTPREWPAVDGAITATAELRPVDARLLEAISSQRGSTVFSLTETGLWIQSGGGQQAVTGFCPAGDFPAFRCEYAGEQTSRSENIRTLSRVSQAAETSEISLDIDADRLTMEAGPFGGTVPIEPLSARDQRLTKLEDVESQSGQVATARVGERFRIIVDQYGHENGTVTVDANTESLQFKTQTSETTHEVTAVQGKGSVTVDAEDLLRLYEPFEMQDARPTLAWGETGALRMRFQSAGWTIDSYLWATSRSE